MTFDALLEENYDSLTKSEKKVAEYILMRGEKIIYNTMSDVKEKTNVGDATIIRFCQKMGFSGFSDLKICIAKEDLSKESVERKESTFYTKSALNVYTTLKKTEELFSLEKLEKALKLIASAKSIYIFGVSSSGNTARDLEGMFLRVGVRSNAVTDTHFQAQIASLLTEEDLVIAFSLTGRTKDTYDSLKIAKDNHAKILSITNYLISPIAKLSDVVLQTAMEEFLDGGSLAGKVSQLYICDLLVSGYENKIAQNTLELREKVLRSILDKGIE